MLKKTALALTVLPQTVFAHGAAAPHAHSIADAGSQILVVIALLVCTTVLGAALRMPQRAKQIDTSA